MIGRAPRSSDPSTSARFRKSRLRPEGPAHIFVGAEAFRRNATIGKGAPTDATSRLKAPPGCVDVTSQKLGTGFALIGAEGYRRQKKDEKK
jgi:hypothetical protein